MLEKVRWRGGTGAKGWERAVMHEAVEAGLRGSWLAVQRRCFVGLIGKGSVTGVVFR